MGVNIIRGLVKKLYFLPCNFLVIQGNGSVMKIGMGYICYSPTRTLKRNYVLILLPIVLFLTSEVKKNLYTGNF